MKLTQVNLVCIIIVGTMCMRFKVTVNNDFCETINAMIEV